ncbi:MAG: hypothetical protein U5K30_17685 [Acidimicrobiales bacterium]|nr:hypothetical protein [Acidimicrobiales bacterium]
MADDETEFTPEEIAEADALDAQIDEALAGRPRADTPDTVLLLSAAIRTDPPPSLAHRVEARHEHVLRRRWRPFRYAAAAMAYLFISQGLGSLLWGDWVAEGVGDDFSPHVTREAAFALIAVGIAVAAGAVARRLAPVSAATGVPLAIAFGVAGVGEIGVFAAGAVLHLSQGAVGVILAVTFWRYWRDIPGRRDEDGA